MDKLLRPRSLTALDEEIERLVGQLQDMSPEADGYAARVNYIKTLCEAREKKNDRVISAEMLVGVAANLIGLLVVLNFEKTGAITSKAFTMLWKK